MLQQTKQKMAFVLLSLRSQRLCEWRPEEGEDQFFCDMFMRCGKQNQNLCETEKSRIKTILFDSTELHRLTCSPLIFRGS